MRRCGYTLIEMMLTVAVIGLLGSLAYPSYRGQVAKARRSEAIGALNGIYTLQRAYEFENRRYADTFDELGFELSGATRVDERTIQARIYSYTMRSLPQDGRQGANFQAIATGDIDPSDPFLDILMIENDLILLD